MQRNPSFIYRICLAAGDALGLLLSFTAAYILRVTFSFGSPYAPHVAISAAPYITSVALLLPFWIILFYTLGLYAPSVYLYRPREIGRLFIAAVLGVVMMIAVSFFTSDPLFPGKLVPIYAFIISFVLLVIIRAVLRTIRLLLLDRTVGAQRLLIIGDNEVFDTVISHIVDTPRTGYTVVGLITHRTLSQTFHGIPVFPTLKDALGQTPADVIMQTDLKESNETYETAVAHHMEYKYVPAHKALATSRHTSDIVGGLPIITVTTTPLIGYGQVVKRLFDLLVSIPAVLILSPIMALIALAIKLGDPKGPVFMHGKMAIRVTRYNKKFHVYKFRSHYAKFDGKTDEEVFRMIGKPELIKEYRKNGDKLPHDFRVTPVGRFLRRFSLDELPQLFNVIKGDLSLVGPRALVPHEIDKFDKWRTILSVKSGLTGLAVISGRRSISFEERRQLDLYYVQNWSFWFDITILLRTLRVILSGKGT